ncbi:MAG: hypothetical protein ABSG84_19125 [Acidobacteriaceae bacterium]|jgi:hypothetical protein
MKNVVQPLLRTRIRSMEPRDFAFVRSLAAEFSTFTVPSEYLLWFFTQFHPEYCQVLEQESGDLRAYLLAIPTSNPANGIAIWQVAATTPNHPFALEYFAAYLRDLAERTSATSIFFTAQQESVASLRLIRSLARQFFDCDVVQLNSVPSGQGEYEFQLPIGTGRSKTKEIKKVE